MMLRAIWAQNLMGLIGDGKSMPWHVPEDLQHFKKLTLGSPIIMGDARGNRCRCDRCRAGRI